MLGNLGRYQRAALIPPLNAPRQLAIVIVHLFSLLAHELLNILSRVLPAEVLGVLLALGEGPSLERLCEPPEVCESV